MFSKNNTAKEYVLRSVAEIIQEKPAVSILDFACGTCLIWKSFFEKFGNINFSGFDFNAESIRTAREKFPSFKEKIFVLDGQQNLPFINHFDIITTFSSLEHVLDKRAFLENIKKLLKSEGIAFINYDHGHFRKGLFNDLINFLSQLIAKIGITEKYFTKKVEIEEIKEILKEIELEIMDIKFFNVQELKTLYKKIPDLKLIENWYEYEITLNSYSNKKFLEEKLSSVVMQVRKNG